MVGSNAQIGEVDSSDENLIVASHGAGVWLEGSGAQVEENEIRAITGVAGSGNGRGVFNDGATDSIIRGNVIRRSTSGDGVVIGGGSAGVDILGNQISANAGLGIDTRDDGVTPNDPPGPVDHENFPVLEETAAGAGGTLDVSGRFRARGEGFAGQSYRIELFSNAACDPSGNGEGAELLAQQVSTTNSDGVVDLTFIIPGTTTGALTATATPLAAGNNRSTSEFSECLVIGGGGGARDARRRPGERAVHRDACRSRASRARRSSRGRRASRPLRSATSRSATSRSRTSRSRTSRSPTSRSRHRLHRPARAAAAGDVLARRHSAAAAGRVACRAAGHGVRDGAAAERVAARRARALAATRRDREPEPRRPRPQPHPLGRVPAVAVVLGADVQLSELDLPGTADWCQLTGPGVTCSPSSNVLAISIQGAPIADIPIADIPIADIPIADIPIADIPDRRHPDCRHSDPRHPDRGHPDRRHPDRGHPDRLQRHPLRSRDKLYDAFVGDWFRPTATLGQLLIAIQGLQTDHDVTLADVLVLLFSSTAAIGWEQIDLETAGLQAAAGWANAVDWNADVQLTAPETIATVTLPQRVRLRPERPRRRFARCRPACRLRCRRRRSAPTRRATSPSNGRSSARSARPLRISFQTFPPFRVGPQAGTLEATAGGPVATSDSGADLRDGDVRAERRVQPRARQPGLALRLVRHAGRRPRLLRASGSRAGIDDPRLPQPPPRRLRPRDVRAGGRAAAARGRGHGAARLAAARGRGRAPGHAPIRTAARDAGRPAPRRDAATRRRLGEPRSRG